MPSLVDVYNAALAHLGSEPITDPNDDSEAARVLRSRFDAIRDAVLRAHPWNCATARTTLPADATLPAWGFDYAYTIPTDCLRVLSVIDSRTDWRVERGKILTDETAPISIRYIVRETDPERWDALLAEAIAAKLAHACCYRLTNSRQGEEQVGDIYKALLAEARSINGQEGEPEDLYEGSYLSARY